MTTGSLLLIPGLLCDATVWLPQRAALDGVADIRVAEHRMVALARERGMRAMGLTWVRGMVHPSRLSDSALMAAILDMIDRRTPDFYAAQIRAMLGRPDATAVLPQIHCPTLVLCGREDTWSPLERHRRLAALIPASTLTIIEDCGHMSTLEQPDAVNAALRWWLTQ